MWFSWIHYSESYEAIIKMWLGYVLIYEAKRVESTSKLIQVVGRIHFLAAGNYMTESAFC